MTTTDLDTTLELRPIEELLADLDFWTGRTKFRSWMKPSSVGVQSFPTCWRTSKWSLPILKAMLMMTTTCSPTLSCS